jgi:hypothetical protein
MFLNFEHFIPLKMKLNYLHDKNELIIILMKI